RVPLLVNRFLGAFSLENVRLATRGNAGVPVPAGVRGAAGAFLGARSPRWCTDVRQARVGATDWDSTTTETAGDRRVGLGSTRDGGWRAHGAVVPARYAQAGACGAIAPRRRAAAMPG